MNSQKIGKQVRKSLCSHCNIEFVLNRKGQKFCNASCRSANWQLNNRINRQPIVSTNRKMGDIDKISFGGLTLGDQRHRTAAKKSVLYDAGIAAIPVVLNNRINRSNGVGNSDIIKRLDELSKGISILRKTQFTIYEKLMELNQTVTKKL